MSESKCPVCGCLKFYVKNPDDPYETCEFECRDGEIVYTPGVDDADKQDIGDETDTFCDKCAWHGEFKELKKD